MIRPLVFRPRAVADLNDIWDCTADRWGAGQAERYVADLRDVCEALARGERIGQDAAAIRLGYRKIRSGRYLIFHLVRPDGEVEIVRILHERMNVTAHLGP